MELITGLLIGFVFGFVFGLVSLSGPLLIEDRAEALKASCEKSLPRHQVCIMAYVPETKARAL